MKKIITSIYILFLLTAAAFAQPAFVKDISPLSENFTEVGNTLFFTVENALWKSDGTEGGTVLVKSGLDDPGNLFALNGLLYFLNDRSGTYPYQYAWKELWRSDGTVSGTILLKSSDMEEVRLLKNIGSTQYFTVNTAASGRELWKTNGSLAGTQLVKDINPGLSDGIDDTFSEVVGTQLFFVADNGIHGAELWKTNGTNAGTSMVKDINPGAGNGVRVGFSSSTVANGNVFFVGNNGVDGAALWKSNGTNAGTIMVKDINPSSSDFFSESIAGTFYEYMPPAYLTNVDGTVFFVPLETFGGSGEYVHLWKSNGTTAGTVLVKEVPAEELSNFVSLNGRLLFSALYGISNTVWSSDGTESGTMMIKNHTRGGDNYLGAFIRVGNQVVFTDNVQGFAYQLWKTDATASGTQMIREMNSAPGEFEVVDNFLFYTEHGAATYFEAGDGVNDYELWQSDLTPEGTFMVRNISDRSFAGSYNLEEVNGMLFFATGYPVHSVVFNQSNPDSTKLWKYTSDPFVVHELTLVNSDTDTDIRALKDNDTIYTDQVVSIRAKKSGPVGSMRFFVNGRHVRTENVAPYALAGDSGGDYNEWMKEEGAYEITAVPFSGAGASGLQGKPFTKTVVVLSPSDTLSISTFFTLMNADTDTEIRNLEDGDTIFYSSLKSITIRANPEEPVGSVAFFLNGSHFWTENASPYALRGDAHGDYAPWRAAPGNYTLTARVYSGFNRSGALLHTEKIHFTVVETFSSMASFHSNDVMVFPNPSNERVAVRMVNTEEEISEIMITDLNGNIYYQGIPSNLNSSGTVGVDLNELKMSSGLYIIRVKLKDHTEKIVKLIKN